MNVIHVNLALWIDINILHRYALYIHTHTYKPIQLMKYLQVFEVLYDTMVLDDTLNK